MLSNRSPGRMRTGSSAAVRVLCARESPPLESCNENVRVLRELRSIRSDAPARVAEGLLGLPEKFSSNAGLSAETGLIDTNRSRVGSDGRKRTVGLPGNFPGAAPICL